VLSPIFMGMMVVGMSLTGFLKGVYSLFTVFTVSGLLLLIAALILIPLFQEKQGAVDVLNRPDRLNMEKSSRAAGSLTPTCLLSLLAF
jgi:hypothetical protein